MYQDTDFLRMSIFQENCTLARLYVSALLGYSDGGAANLEVMLREGGREGGKEARGTGKGRASLSLSLSDCNM